VLAVWRQLDAWYLRGRASQALDAVPGRADS
jgi:hypothetical protein